MPNPPRTYKKAGIYFIRLFVPKHLRSPTGAFKIVKSLGTKDRQTAFVRAMRINLAFEDWAAMATKSDEFLSGLTVAFPNGVKADFDMLNEGDKAAYFDLLNTFKNPGAPAIGEQAAEPVAKTRQTRIRSKIIDVFESFREDIKGKYAPKTAHSHAAKAARFVDYCHGLDLKFIDEVTPAIALGFRNKIRIGRDDTTTDSYTNANNQFFAYAKANQAYAHASPFKDLNLLTKAQRVKTTEQWFPFLPSELNMLLEIQVYRRRFDKPDLFYSPIIALTMGGRLEELTQLRASDVRIDKLTKLWVIDINANSSDKRLKTPAAARVLPISAQLLKTDFLEYHAYIIKTFGESSLLYPYLIKGKNGYGKTLGYNFTQHKQSLIAATSDLHPALSRPQMVKKGYPFKSLLLDEERKCFHSLRKCFGYALKEQNIDSPLRKRLLGHNYIDGDVTESTYSGDASLANLKKVMDQVDFGFDFSQYQMRANWERLLDKLMATNGVKKRISAASGPRAEIKARRELMATGIRVTLASPDSD